MTMLSKVCMGEGYDAGRGRVLALAMGRGRWPVLATVRGPVSVPGALAHERACPASATAYPGDVPIRDELIERTVRQLSAMLARLVRSTTSEGDAVLAHVTPAEGASGEGTSGQHATSQASASEVARARQELDTLYRSHLGTTPELLHRLDAENLLDVLSSAGSVDGERAYLVAALFSAEASVELAGGAADDDALVLGLRERAFDLLLEAALSGLGEADLPTRIAALADSLSAASRRPATWERLHLFEHDRGAYARAEDALFGWLESLAGERHQEADAEPAARSGEATSGAEPEYGLGAREVPPTSRVEAAAIAFYDELEKRTDEELRSGGLERAELAEGRADFSRRLGAVRA
jgi:hypothetical protein